MLEKISDEGGFFFFCDWPWPASKRLLFMHKFLDVELLISQTEDARLLVELKRTDSSNSYNGDEAYSCQIIPRSANVIMGFVQWRDRKISEISVDEKWAFSSTDRYKSEKRIYLDHGASAVVEMTDFDQENSDAIKRRRAKLDNWPRREGRLPFGQDYAFSCLLSELLQMKDLIEHIRAGKIYHLAGLMSRVRLMLIGDHPMGLLQTCAAYKNSPLIIYSTAQIESPPIECAQSFAFNALPNKSHPLCQNPIDIDVWMRQYAISIGNKKYNNDLVIREIGNTVASHRDLDVQKSVAFLSSSNFETIDNLSRFSLMVADLVINLAEYLLVVEAP